MGCRPAAHQSKLRPHCRRHTAACAGHYLESTDRLIPAEGVGARYGRTDPAKVILPFHQEGSLVRMRPKDYAQADVDVNAVF